VTRRWHDTQSGASCDCEVCRARRSSSPEMNLRRQLQAIWVGGRTPPAGAIRDLLSHIISAPTPSSSQ
jgi:hypothetical protein